ncbi:MAG: carbonic anhydrase [bacterium]|nr:carbonic anhydrase [bacterium]
MNLRPKVALETLVEGNQRFITDQSRHPHESTLTRRALLDGQNPMACILGCSDSRVPPQLVFDQGLGDLFMVRVAGNLLDGVTLGSLEFAVTVLGVPLVLVLGHEDCGAVKAAIAVNQGGTPNLHHLTDRIQPILKLCKNPSDLDEAVRTNAIEVARRLRQETVFSERIADGSLLVVAAYYDLATGHVDILER